MKTKLYHLMNTKKWPTVFDTLRTLQKEELRPALLEQLIISLWRIPLEALGTDHNTADLSILHMALLIEVLLHSTLPTEAQVAINLAILSHIILDEMIPARRI